MKKIRTDIGKRLLAMMLVTAMAFTLQGICVSAETATGENGQIQLAAAGSENPANPVHHCTKRNDGSDYTDWSYVYFGRYPQSEVTGDDLTSAITGASYDANGDASVNGVKYRRISYYDKYHYYKWERIRWRVLRNDGQTLFLMADKALEQKNYNETDALVTWENCTLRSWLNDTFYKTAFSSSEQNAIVEQTVVNEDNPQFGTEGGNNTKDKVYLLSIGEAQDPGYGFCESDTVDSVSRMTQPSDNYRMGTISDNYSSWLLRSPGSAADRVAYVSSGEFNETIPNSWVYHAEGIVPVLHVNLTSSLWQGNKAPTVSTPSAQSVKAGTSATFSVNASGGNPDRYTYQWYCSRLQTVGGNKIEGATSASYTIPASQVADCLDGRYYYCAVSNGIYEVESERAKLTVSPKELSPSSPVHHCLKWGDGDDYTDWSYVYFGSYPQTEVTGSALTASITGAPYDANGDAWVNGVKYRRISKNDVANDINFGDSTYCYFKWERIKWRILKNNDSTLFVMADKALDCKKYDEVKTTGVTWDICTLRNWLNDSFYKTAFSSSEQNAIIEQTVKVSGQASIGKPVDCEDTRDNVYLLSESEVMDLGYGFCDYLVSSTSRHVQASNYASVRGVNISKCITYGGNCLVWYLRSLGYGSSDIACVSKDGGSSYGGVSPDSRVAVVPVLHIDLSSPFWHLTDDGSCGAGGSIGNTAPTVSAPSAQSVKAGTSATFSVTASGGGPDTYTYQWYYAASQTEAGTKIEDATSASYTISASQVEDDLNGRYYYCVVSNEAYEVASERAKLTVYSSPEVSGPQSQSVPAGEGAGFYVTASGGNPASYTYQWYYATSQSGAGTRIEGATEPVYMIPSGQMTASLNGRYYYCIVSNGECETESTRAKLTVLAEGEQGSTAPTVSVPAAQSVKAGNSATFSVSASGGKPDTYTYQWYYAISQSGAGIKIEGATSASYTVPASQVTASLNGRYYYCVVSNGVYEVESARAKMIVLSEEEPDSTAPTVSVPAAQSVKAGSSATFSVSASGGKPDTYTYQWYYATSQSGTGTRIAGATSSSYTIPSSQMTSGLNGRYYYCVVSNGVYEVESARAKLTVAQESNPGNNTPPSLKTQKITASSFTKEYGSKPFSLKAKTTGNGKLTYKTSNKKVAAVSSKGKVTVKNYGTATITIKAAKTSKYKAASAKVTVKVIPKKAVLTKASATGNRKVSIKWKKVGAIDGYEMYLSLKKNFKSETFKRVYGKNQTSVTLTGLQKGKTYYIKIRCYKKVGKKTYYGGWSKVKKVKIR